MNFKERNNFQVPAYHHLDVSYTTSKKKKYVTRSWIFAVYNIYGHNYYFSVQYRYEDQNSHSTEIIWNRTFSNYSIFSMGIWIGYGVV